MSFGFSISDVVILIQETNNVRKRFVAAPKQFEEIQEE